MPIYPGLSTGRCCDACGMDDVETIIASVDRHGLSTFVRLCRPCCEFAVEQFARAERAAKAKAKPSKEPPCPPAA